MSGHARDELEFQDVVRKRKMVREFEQRPIPKEVVDRILSNAQRGPSSGYTQGFEFLILDDHGTTSKFWEHLESQKGPHQSMGMRIENQSWNRLRNAPLIIIPLAHSNAYVRRYLEPDKVAAGRKTEEDWPAPYWYVDTAFAAMLILQTAVDSGLGAFYFSIGPTKLHIPKFQQAFGIPEEYYPIGAIAVGYPAQSPSNQRTSASRGRRPRSDVMHFGKW